MGAPEIPPSDEDLVRRAQAGDAPARTNLVERFEPRLRARARRRIPSALRGKVAESDVIQEAWIAAFLRLAEFKDRGEGSFQRFIATVLDRKVLDETRRYAGTGKRDARREVGAGTSVERILGAANDPSPSVVAARVEERARLDAAIATLPEAQRTVLLLVHDCDLTYVEAGERLGRTPDAVRMLYGRAVVALAKVIGAPPAPRS
jgi:RNA polymerase sigma-70 factor, ECF subfamily